jgi:hypothetical protein
VIADIVLNTLVELLLLLLKQMIFMVLMTCYAGGIEIAVDVRSGLLLMTLIASDKSIKFFIQRFLPPVTPFPLTFNLSVSMTTLLLKQKFFLL